MLSRLKSFLTSSPVQFNGKPIATWKILLPILLISLISLTPFLINRLNHPNRPPTPDEIAQKQYQKAKDQAQALSSLVAKQTQVPTDETPNVATITDVTKLQDQEFFQQARNG